MKNFLTFLILIIFTSPVFSQDTLSSQDFPGSGSVYVLSSDTAFAGINVTATGANYNWDFSNLEKRSQRLDTMYSTSDTDPLLSFFFINNQFNVNRANHATNGANFDLGTVGVNDVFNYYYNSATDYRQPGFGAVINGLPLPVAYSPHDVIYKYPVNYSNEDSVAYSYEVDLSTTVGLYFRVNRTRHNTVDGWGSLTTPFGTFDVLRIKSVLTEQDSIYVDTFNLGVNLPLVRTIEYKWLGKGFGLPLLQINTNETNVVSEILYQDSLDLTAVNAIPSFIFNPLVFPNPASENVIVRYSLHKNTDIKISMIGSDGKLIFEKQNENQPAGENVKFIDLTEYNLSPGNYFIKLESENSVKAIPLLINR